MRHRPLLQLIILGLVLGAVIVARLVLRPRPRPTTGDTEQPAAGRMLETRHQFNSEIALHRHAHGALALGRVRVMALDETPLTRAMVWRLAAHLTRMPAVEDIAAGPPPEDGRLDADWFVVLGPPHWQDPTDPDTPLRVQLPVHIGSQPLPGLIAADDPAWLLPALPFAMTGSLVHRSLWSGSIDADTVAQAMAKALYDTIATRIDSWSRQIGPLGSMPSALTVATPPPAPLGEVPPVLRRSRPLWSDDGWWPGPPQASLQTMADSLSAAGWAIVRRDQTTLVANQNGALTVVALLEEPWRGLLPQGSGLVLRSASPLPATAVAASLDQLAGESAALALAKPLSPWWSAAQQQRWLTRASDSLDIDLLLWAAEDLAEAHDVEHSIITDLIHQAWNVLRISDPLRQDRASRVRRLAEAHGIDSASLGGDVSAWCQAQGFMDLDAARTERADGTLAQTISAQQQVRWFARAEDAVVSMTIAIDGEDGAGRLLIRHLDARSGSWNQGTASLGPGDRPIVRRVFIDARRMARVEIARPSPAPALRVTVTTTAMNRTLPGRPAQAD